MAQTGIEWTDATWNPIGGCSIASPGCTNCYAQKLAGTRLRNHPLYRGTTDRAASGAYVFNGHLTLADLGAGVWTFPKRWRGIATPRMGAGAPSLIFVGDMSDLFHEERPFEDIDRVLDAFGEAVHAGRRHIGQLLTKRPEVMRRYFTTMFDRRGLSTWPYLRHLWLGFSAERQREYDEREQHMQVLAAMGFQIFVSYEPAIGPLVLSDWFLAQGGRAWVIAGAESGSGAREFDRAWFDAVSQQCADAGVPFFMKQITVNGRKVPMEEWPDELRVRQFPFVAGAVDGL